MKEKPLLGFACCARAFIKIDCAFVEFRRLPLNERTVPSFGFLNDPIHQSLTDTLPSHGFLQEEAIHIDVFAGTPCCILFHEGCKSYKYIFFFSYQAI